MRRHTAVIFLFFLLLISGSSACAADIGLRVGMPFLEARSVLQKAHWMPVDVHTNDGYEFIGVERKLKDRNIDEVESCAIDAAICIFNYRKNQECIRLLTHGEEINDMRVRSWSNTCPESR